jgi:methionine synthase I (cobalamin-dependent)
MPPTPPAAPGVDSAPMEHPIVAHLRDRVLVLDGAMGTMIQREALDEAASAASASATTRAT